LKANCPESREGVMLQGKKTYLVALAWGLAVAGNMAGLITPEQLQLVETILLPLGLAALRAGVGKV